MGNADSSGDAEREMFFSVFDRKMADFHWVQDAELDTLQEELNASGVRHLYEAMGGLVFTPLSDDKGTTLHSFRKLHQALRLVERYESRERQRRFEWLIFSRTDLIWEADHPPLSLLSPQAIWIPKTYRHDSDGSNGICD